MTSAPSEQRPLDLVVLGATGFTGRLVARYLHTHAQTKSLRWALAGRSREKLEAVQSELAGLDARAVPELRLVNSSDLSALRDLASETRVVLSTVGPFILHGLPLVQACVERSTDYVDITGEPAFVATLIERHHREAARKGLRIIPCCGFDSVPHDLGAQFTRELLPADEPVQIEGFVSAGGRASGGTWQTFLHAASNPAESAASRPGWSEPALVGRIVKALRPSVRYESALQRWVGPLPTIDPRIVLRSARLDPSYGTEFRYAHYVAVKRLGALVGLGVGAGAVAALAQLGPTRRWLEQRQPAGQGPSEEQRAKSFFKVLFHGSSTTRRARTEVSGGDPGYGETSKMVSEAALALLFDREKLAAATGVATPASGLGTTYRERLQRAGLRFHVLEAGPR